ncbi:hypothetical protein AHAS_Ahas01G0015500 [Arachis hypogaea]
MMKKKTMMKRKLMMMSMIQSYHHMKSLQGGLQGLRFHHFQYLKVLGGPSKAGTLVKLGMLFSQKQVFLNHFEVFYFYFYFLFLFLFFIFRKNETTAQNK